jgi:hypothetical protein
MKGLSQIVRDNARSEADHHYEMRDVKCKCGHLYKNHYKDYGDWVPRDYLNPDCQCKRFEIGPLTDKDLGRQNK